MENLNLDKLIESLISGYGNECSCSSQILELDENIRLEKTSCSSNHLESTKNIPVGVSNRHLHLSKEDLEKLFGKGYKLTAIKDLKQPGQFACKETVLLAGPKSSFNKVRILGPTRNQTQVEISKSDSIALGIKTPLRNSGDLESSAPCVLVGPKGAIVLNEGLIIAKRHIHMSSDEGKNYGLKDQDIVKVRSIGERSMIMENVLVRVGEGHSLEFHIDIDEANSAGLDNGDKIEIL